MKRPPLTPWFPFRAPELELALALFGCVVTVLTLAGVERQTIGAAAGGYAVVVYLAGLLVYARREAQAFSFLPGGGLGGRGYVDLVRGARQSLLLMHVDDDAPVDELVGIYRGLLDRGVEQRRLIFLREDARPEAYGWLEQLGMHPNLEQRVVLPEQAEVMRMSFVVVDEKIVVLSVPGGTAIDSRAYARGLVFRDLLVVRDASVAAAFVEIHRQVWSEAAPVAELRRLCDPVTFLAEVRRELAEEE